MIDRVKRFGSVEKEEELGGFFFDGVIEEGVNADDVVFTRDTGHKAFLSWVGECADGWHDAPGNSGGEEAVVGVGDADGASIGDEAGQLFGDEEQDTVVEVGGRGLTAQEGVEDVEKDRDSERKDSTPSSKGNTVRARGGVVRGFDGVFDVRNGGARAEGGVDFFVIVAEEGGGGGWARGVGAALPNFTPVVRSDL